MDRRQVGFAESRHRSSAAEAPSDASQQSDGRDDAKGESWKVGGGLAIVFARLVVWAFGKFCGCACSLLRTFGSLND